MLKKIAILALLAIVPASSAVAQMMEAAASRPTTAAAIPPEERRNQRIVERVLESTERYVAGVVGMKDEQRADIKTAIAEARKELEALGTPRGGRAARREGRDERLEILERMRARVRAALPPGNRAALPDTPPRFERADDHAEATTKPASTRPGTGPTVGQAFSPFRMTRVDGKLVTNESLMGKPAVIVFASWSSPVTRDQLPRIADLAARYGSRVNWLVVYTKEMFPAGDAATPERNRDDRIEAPPATTDAERMTAAKKLAEQMKLKLEIAPDAIDDRLTRGANGFPNAAFVLDAQGRVVARFDWAEPFAIKRHVDRLLAAK